MAMKYTPAPETLPTGTKWCTKCASALSRDDFQGCSARADGKQPYCKNCSNGARMASYHANALSQRTVSAQWYSANRDRKLSTMNEWKRTNRQQLADASARRKTWERSTSGPTLTRRDVREAREMAGGICAYCLRPAELQTDHVIALVNGGEHTADNIVMACGPCNMRKARSGPLAMVRLTGGKSWL